jgi:hypothetical protein
VLSLRAADSGKLLFRLSFAEMLKAEMLRRYLQTESKGNFCLITVYTHKNVPQPQNIRAKKQTFSNLFYFVAFVP